LQLRLSEQSSSSRSKPVPRCSHHKRQNRRDGARTLHAPGVQGGAFRVRIKTGKGRRMGKG